MRRLKGLLVNDASLAGHHGSALVTAQARDLAAEAGIDMQTGWDWEAAEKALGGQHDFDLVVVNGEGSIHHDSASARRIAELAQALRQRGLPAYLINASEEHNTQGIYEGLALFRRRYVRDEASRASLARAGLAADVVPDLTLTWQNAPIAEGRGELFVTDASDSDKSRALLRFANRIGGVPLTLRSAPPWPARGSPRRWFAFQGKQAAARVLPTSPWSLRYAGAIRTHGAFIDRLAHEASGIICGRYHAVCIALCMQLPFLAVGGNISKVENLLDQVGLDSRFMDFSTLVARPDAPVVPPLSDDERQAIRVFLEDTRAKARAMFTDIAQDARGSDHGMGCQDR